MQRVLIGLSVGSGLEGVDAAAVRAAGVGLDLAPVVAAAVRVAFPPSVKDALKPDSGGRAGPRGPEFIRNVADTVAHAARQVLTRAGISPRDTFAVGLLEPARPATEPAIVWPE